MSIHMTFERTNDTRLKQIVQLLSGPYVHTEIIVTSAHDTEPHIRRKAYSAYVDYVFCGTDEKDYRVSDETHDVIQIAASSQEIEDIKSACETHVELETPYNLKDMILSVLPGRKPTEKDIYHVKTLFCSQAMVLILRACLEPTHPVQAALKGVNSRTVSPSQLYRILTPVCTKAYAKQVMRRT